MPPQASPRLGPRSWRLTYLVAMQQARLALKQAAFRRRVRGRLDSGLWFGQAFFTFLYRAEPTSSGTLSFSSLPVVTSCARVTLRCDCSHNGGCAYKNPHPHA